MGQVTSNLNNVASNIKGYFTPSIKDGLHKDEAYSISLQEKNLFHFGSPLASCSDEKVVSPRLSLKRSAPVSPSKSESKFFFSPKRKKLEEEYLDFPFLEDLNTVKYIDKSKVIFILRGLPGSGKSTLAKKIENTLDSIEICSADDFFMNNGIYVFDGKKLSEALNHCQRNAIEAVRNQSNLVIDNTNICLWEMKFYLNLAKEYNYKCIILEPKTPWKIDLPVLAEKNSHNLNEEKLQWKYDSFEELLPLYYGWFVNEKDATFLNDVAFNWLKDCFLCEEFSKDFSLYTGIQSFDCVDTWYKRPAGNGNLRHCTAKFTGKGNAPGATEYMQNSIVINSIGKRFDIEVIGFVITPRTFGARVRLSNDQLDIWGSDDNENIPDEYWFFDYDVLNESHPEQSQAEIQEPNQEPVVNASEAEVNGSVQDPEVLQNSLSVEIAVNGCTQNGSIEQEPQVDFANEDSCKDNYLGDQIDGLVENKSNGLSNQMEPLESEIIEVRDIQERSNGIQVHESPMDASSLTNTENNSLDCSAKLQLDSSHSSKDSPSKSPIKRKSPKKGGSGGIPIPSNDLPLTDSITALTCKVIPQTIPDCDRYTPTFGAGSRAHLTLACAPDEMAVTTGLDLLFAIKNEKMANEKHSQNNIDMEVANGRPTASENGCSENSGNGHSSESNKGSENVKNFPLRHVLSKGVLASYGNGLWVIYPNEKLVMSSLFTSHQ